MFISSFRAVRQVFGSNRSFILTRSSFPGVGKYSGHWLGDNAANWNDIKWAIPGMLEFNLFGVPYVSTNLWHIVLLYDMFYAINYRINITKTCVLRTDTCTYIHLQFIIILLLYLQHTISTMTAKSLTHNTNYQGITSLLKGSAILQYACWTFFFFYWIQSHNYRRYF